MRQRRRKREWKRRRARRRAGWQAGRQAGIEDLPTDGLRPVFRWSERISILSIVSSPWYCYDGGAKVLDTHTHTQDCALRKKVFRKLRAVAGLLLIVSRRLRVPVHNKLPIRGQMIVFQLGSVSIGWLYCMCAKRGIRRPYSFALHRPNESQLIPFGSGPFYSHSHTRSLLLVDIETLFSESLHRKRGSRYRKKTTYTSGF